MIELRDTSVPIVTLQFSPYHLLPGGLGIARTAGRLAPSGGVQNKHHRSAGALGAGPPGSRPNSHRWTRPSLFLAGVWSFVHSRPKRAALKRSTVTEEGYR